MPDAVQIFPPGFRVLDSSGTPISGAKIKVYDAGTLTPRTVYSNSGLSSSLGSTVYTDSAGVPVASQGSSTPVMVYTGTTAYKIIFTTSADVAIITLDNIKGALDTSTFLTTGSTSTLTIPVASKTGDYTIVAADRGKLINADPTGGAFTLTLTSAVTLGDNWSVLIRNTAAQLSGVAAVVKIAASQNISGPWGPAETTSFALRNGEGALICCNGVSFLVASMSPTRLAGTVGIIEIADRVSSAPVSPNPGARYIVTAGFSTFEAEDLIEADGAGGFFEITPPTDCGWLAYVQDENAFYAFLDAAWVEVVRAATQAEQETATATTPYVSPGRQQYHQSAAKAWGLVNFAAAITVSYNITSLTDDGAGLIGVVIATDFSSANWCGLACANTNSDFNATMGQTPAAGTCVLRTYNQGGTSADANLVSFAAFGEQ